MKKLLILIILLFVNNANATTIPFIRGLYDVPSFSSLYIDEDSIVEFDSLWGSVTEMRGVANINCEEIITFYRNAMPNLGWNIYSDDEGDISFVRQGFNLKIVYKDVGSQCAVSFSQNN